MRNHTSFKKRLALHRETLRTLRAHELEAAMGAASFTLGDTHTLTRTLQPQPHPPQGPTHPHPQPNTTTIASAVGAC